MPKVAAGMNAMEKIVFSNTLTHADWENTRVVSGDAVKKMRALKRGRGKPMVILGSGTLVAALAQVGLIDAYQLVTVPVVLGAGRTLFEQVDTLALKRKSTREFKNGNVVSVYVPR
jgi:dihydrofolate reductase